jgi:hypothetical protein
MYVRRLTLSRLLYILAFFLVRPPPQVSKPLVLFVCFFYWGKVVFPSLPLSFFQVRSSYCSHDNGWMDGWTYMYMYTCTPTPRRAVSFRFLFPLSLYRQYGSLHFSHPPLPSASACVILPLASATPCSYLIEFIYSNN